MRGAAERDACEERRSRSRRPRARHADRVARVGLGWRRASRPTTATLRARPRRRRPCRGRRPPAGPGRGATRASAAATVVFPIPISPRASTVGAAATSSLGERGPGENGADRVVARHRRAASSRWRVPAHDPSAPHPGNVGRGRRPPRRRRRAPRPPARASTQTAAPARRRSWRASAPSPPAGRR